MLVEYQFEDASAILRSRLLRPQRFSVPAVTVKSYQQSTGGGMANAFFGKVMGGILGCTMAVAAADAQTLAQSRARLQNLSYEIYDAVPSDGIAAQARFLDEANAWRTQLYFEAYRDDDQSPYSHYSNDDYESVVSKDAMAYGAHRVPVTPQIESVGVYPTEGYGAAGGSWGSALPLVGAQGLSLARGVSFDAFAGFSTTATGNLSPTFYNLVLGAGTGVRIGGYGRAEVWLSDAGSWASAYVELFARFSPRAADGSFQNQLRVTRRDVVWVEIDLTDPAFQLPHDPLVKRVSERWMSLTYENLSDQEQIGRVRFSSAASGEAMAPVPEPQAWALMLLGLPLLLAWRHRRASQPGAA